MTQRVRDESGVIHNFPDEVTPEQIKSALFPSERDQMLSAIKSAMSNSPLYMLGEGAKDIAGGIAHGVQSMGQMMPDVQSMMPRSEHEAHPANRMDAYKLFGTEDKPISTPGGALQSIGELVSSGINPAQGIQNIEKIISREVNPVKGFKEGWNLASKGLDFAFPYRVAQRTAQEAEKQSDEVSKITKGLSEHLGKGATNTEETSQSIANDVRKLHDEREANAGEYFNHVLNQVRNTKDEGLLYNKANPLISTAMDEGKGLMSEIKDLHIGDLFEKFKSKPTFENAHNLQQELGLAIGDLKKIPGKSAAQRLELGKLNNARNQLKDDMMSYLKDKYPNKNENLAPIWQQGIDLYKEHVAPLLSNPKLRQINRGRKNYVKNIHQAFENPEAADEITRAGERIQGSGSKLLNMLPESTKDKILFSKIGAHSGEDAGKFLSAIDTASRKGYSKYLTPATREGISSALEKQQHIEELGKQVKKLMDKQSFRNKLYGITTVGGGSALGLSHYLKSGGKSATNLEGQENGS